MLQIIHVALSPPKSSIFEEGMSGERLKELSDSRGGQQGGVREGGKLEIFLWLR